jgi:hypothetical protein
MQRHPPSKPFASVCGAIALAALVGCPWFASLAVPAILASIAGFLFTVLD